MHSQVNIRATDEHVILITRRRLDKLYGIIKSIKKYLLLIFLYIVNRANRFLLFIFDLCSCNRKYSHTYDCTTWWSMS